MGIDDRLKNAAKRTQGQVEEGIGKMTDNNEAQAKGKAKQVEADLRDGVEDGKDNIKKMID